MLTFAGRTHDITGETLIGRHATCSIVLEDDLVSRRHARVAKIDGLWMIEDCGSAAGTLLNGMRITEAQPLADKAVIRIGSVELVYTVGEGTGKARSVPPTSSLPWLQLVGRTISGHRIDAVIGRGNIAVVYRAHQPALQRDVAFKVFDPRFTAGAAARFRAGVSRVGVLSHPGLATLHEAGEEGGLLWCSVELVQGETAAALIKRDGSIAPAMALLIAEKAAEALAAAHQAGVVHGDLRPTTIFIASDGRVRLTDAGMTPIFDDAELDPAGHPRLAWYSAPELHSGGSHSSAADLYSLGCVIWHLLTGAPPFNGASAGAVSEAHATRPIPALPGTVKMPQAIRVRLDTLLRSLLAKQPGKRPTNLAAIQEELRDLRDDLDRAQVGAKARPTTRRRTKTNDGFPFLGVILALLVIGGVGYAFWYWRQHPPAPTGAPPVEAPAAPAPRPAPATPAPEPVGKPIVHLGFDSPADLQAMDILQGAPLLDGGALTGTANEAVGISVASALPAGAWSVQGALAVTTGDGQAVLSVVAEGKPVALVRVAATGITARIGDKEAKAPKPTGPVQVRLRAAGGSIACAVADKVILTAPAPAAGGQVRFEVAGVTWTLDDLLLSGAP